VSYDHYTSGFKGRVGNGESKVFLRVSACAWINPWHGYCRLQNSNGASFSWIKMAPPIHHYLFQVNIWCLAATDSRFVRDCIPFWITCRWLRSFFGLVSSEVHVAIPVFLPLSLWCRCMTQCALHRPILQAKYNERFALQCDHRFFHYTCISDDMWHHGNRHMTLLMGLYEFLDGHKICRLRMQRRCSGHVHRPWTISYRTFMIRPLSNQETGDDQSEIEWYVKWSCEIKWSSRETPWSPKRFSCPQSHVQSRTPWSFPITVFTVLILYCQSLSKLIKKIKKNNFIHISIVQFSHDS
jgi:hypothetical protein